MSEYAYIRVSSKDQNIARQVAAMLERGIKRSYMYIDTESGKDFERKSYKKLLKRLKAGDVVYIKSIDRLGRNYEEIIVQWGLLTKEKQVDLVVLDFPLLDTRHKENGLTGKFLSDIVLQVLSYEAQMERENIRKRQKEGIQVAKESGVKFGRPRKQVHDQFEVVYPLWKRGEISKRKAAKLLETDHGMFTRWVQRYEKELQKEKFCE